VRLFESESPFFVDNLSENNVIEFAQSNPVQWHNVDKLNRNLLHHAVLLDWKNFAKLVLDHGVNINATDKYHCTPLHLAVFKGNYEMVCLFMKHPLIDSEIPDMDGLTPVDLAEMWDEHRIFKKLTNCLDDGAIKEKLPATHTFILRSLLPAILQSSATSPWQGVEREYFDHLNYLQTNFDCAITPHKENEWFDLSFLSIPLLKQENPSKLISKGVERCQKGELIWVIEKVEGVERCQKGERGEKG